MCFRRFVNLVTNDVRSTYFLRRIDMSRFFRPSSSLREGGSTVLMPVEEGCLPDPTLSFDAPSNGHIKGQMDFFLLKTDQEEQEGTKIVATDQTGRTVLYDIDSRTIRAVPKLTEPKYLPISLTLGNSLYVFDRMPMLHKKRNFDALTFGQPRRSEYKDWSWRSLQPPPFVHETNIGPSGWIESYTVVGDSGVCISTRFLGTYFFDTKKRNWTKFGNWVLPFTGLAEYVPEHKLWFGIWSSDDAENTFCASDLNAASTLTPPALHSIWKDITPPMEGNSLGTYAVHLGSSKFCIARFLQVVTPHVSDNSGQSYGPEDIIAVITGVEVERRGEVLHVVKHKSELYKIAEGQVAYWLF